MFRLLVFIAFKVHPLPKGISISHFSQQQLLFGNSLLFLCQDYESLFSTDQLNSSKVLVKRRILNIFKRSKRRSLNFLILRREALARKRSTEFQGDCTFLAFPSIKIEKHKLNFHILKLFFQTEYSCFHIKCSGNRHCREEISANYVVVTNFENNVHLCLFYYQPLCFVPVKFNKICVLRVG